MKNLAHSLPRLGVPAVALFLGLLYAAPAHAHHAMGGRLPANGFEGFLSGVAHPVIGIDHLAMIVALGLISAMVRPGLWLAAAFIVAAMGGAAIHLAGVSIPGSEALIALSVLLFGVLIAAKRSPGNAVVLGLGALAGLLHGYAYGESIFGAESGSLVAYLIGFTAVQMLVAGGAYAGAKAILQRRGDAPAALRPAGLVLCGVGLALFAPQLVAILLPIKA